MSLWFKAPYLHLYGMIAINLFCEEKLDWPDFLVEATGCPSWQSHMPFFCQILLNLFSPFFLPGCGVLHVGAAIHAVLLLGNKQCQWMIKTQTELLLLIFFKLCKELHEGFFLMGITRTAQVIYGESSKCHSAIMQIVKLLIYRGSFRGPCPGLPLPAALVGTTLWLRGYSFRNFHRYNENKTAAVLGRAESKACRGDAGTDCADTDGCW